MKREHFTGTFFLVICILLTASCLFALLQSTINVIGILACIACWRVYASARSGGDLVGFRLAAGTAKALYIINWVVVGILAVTGLVVMFAGNSLSAFITGGFLYSEYYLDIYDLVRFAGRAVFIWMGLFFLVAAAVRAVVNIFFTHSLCNLIRAMYDRSQGNIGNFDKLEAVSKWLFVLGIITCLGFISIVSDAHIAVLFACSGSCMIAASRWMKESLLPDISAAQLQPQSEWYAPEP